LAGLPVPYDRPYTIELRPVGLPDEGDFHLVLNDCPPVTLPAAALAALPALVRPDGRFSTH